MPKQVLSSYLQRYAVANAEGWPISRGTFEHVLIVPVCDERCTLLDLVKRTRPWGPLLIIAVVNASASRESALRARHRQWIDAHCDLGKAQLLPGEPPRWHITLPDGTTFLIVDHSTSPWVFPDTQGVGLARRIGADIAAHLCQQGIVRTPWLATTDMDARLPRDYWQALHADTQERAVIAKIFRFWHAALTVEATPAVIEAGRHYEIFLRYFTLGLHWAGSPYAFPTLGSCMAVHLRAYAQVRGFPKLRAGEDFYMLMKLAKIGAIHYSRSAPVLLAHRQSNRTPFGTGRALEQRLHQRLDTHSLPDPRIFGWLKQWQQALPYFAAQSDCFDVHDWLQRNYPQQVAASLAQLLSSMGFAQRLQGLHRDGSTLSVKQRRLGEWFDGFYARRFILHIQRTLGLEIPWINALRLAHFVPSAPGLACDSHGLKKWQMLLATHEREQITDQHCGLCCHTFSQQTEHTSSFV